MLDENLTCAGSFFPCLSFNHQQFWFCLSGLHLNQTRLLLRSFLGRLHDEAIDALRRQASEKRQGAKSRSGWGGLAAAFSSELPLSTLPPELLPRLDCNAHHHGFCPQQLAVA